MADPSDDADAAAAAPRPRLRALLRERRMAVICGLGFASGLPYLLTLTVLSAWLTDLEVDTETIASFSLVGLPYTFKWLAGPLVDRYALPYLGRRRGWILTLQLALVAAILFLATSDPLRDPVRLAAAAVAVAFCSALHDLVVDAYNADTLAPHERGAGSAVYTFGYRIAIWITGTFALIAADHVVWQAIYTSLATLMLVGVIAVLFAVEPPATPPRSFGAAVTRPFRDLHTKLRWRGLLLTVLFAATYKFGDYFAETLRATFLRRGVGFTWTEIALINKVAQFTGTVLGSLAAAWALAHHGARRMLVPFGLAQALTNLLFALLAVAGPDYAVLTLAVFVDAVANATGAAALIAIFWSLTSRESSATQYGILVALTSVGTRVFGFLAGPAQAALDWPGFYVLSVFLALPGLLLAHLLGRHLPRDDLPPAPPRAIIADR